LRSRERAPPAGRVVFQLAGTKERRSVNATNQHEQVVEGIVRGIFDALPTEGEWSYRDAVEADLKELTPVQLVDQLQEAELLLEGMINTAERMGVVMQAIHGDTLERVREAHVRALRAAGLDF
jgi:hypothetical protein